MANIEIPINDSLSSYYTEENGYVSVYDLYGYYDFHQYNQGDTYAYDSFEFERPVYLYIWEALVILTTLANIFVISVFMRRSMRNSNNIILITIAVTDSMTGIVTLPVYIYVYASQEEGQENLHLSKVWCEIFMITKHFFSKIFHTMSIWLTVCLAFQRLVSVCFPFRAQSIFTVARTGFVILAIVVISPVLHLYHVVHRKAVLADVEHNNTCTWKLEQPCEEGCVYLWIRFYLVHFIPCLFLVIFTTAMIIVLLKTSKKMRTSHLITSKDSLSKRNADSRRITIIVVAVVCVFLIPEMPYGLFILLSVIFHLGRTGLMHLHTNRLFHCVYQILLVLSFHANFWIYFVMNRRFRRSLKRMFLSTRLTSCGTAGNIGRRRKSDSCSSTHHTITHLNSGGTEKHTQPERDRIDSVS